MPDQILGQTPAELAGEPAPPHATPPAEARPAKPADPDDSHHQMILHSGQTIELEEAYADPQGDTRYLRVVKSPVFGPDGKITGTQGILFDISERKRAEAELAYERDLLQTLLENSPDSIFFKDLAIAAGESEPVGGGQSVAGLAKQLHQLTREPLSTSADYCE